MELNSHTNTKCIDCDSGTYNNVTGATDSNQCIKCSEGRYNTNKGSVEESGLVVIFLGMMVHVANTPFVTGTLNYLETMALSISFLTLYFGLMFFSGWLDRPQEILISTIILGINILFNLYAFSIIFKTTISELIEDYKRSRLPKADQMNMKKQIKNVLQKLFVMVLKNLS